MSTQNPGRRSILRKVAEIVATLAGDADAPRVIAEVKAALEIAQLRRDAQIARYMGPRPCGACGQTFTPKTRLAGLTGQWCSRTCAGRGNGAATNAERAAVTKEEVLQAFDELGPDAGPKEVAHRSGYHTETARKYMREADAAGWKPPRRRAS